MKLFLPSARATNFLLIAGFGALGYALYLRYVGLEQSTVGLACAAGLDTWMCLSRRVAGFMIHQSVFGYGALAFAALHLWRPSLMLFAPALALTALGLVLYNTGLASLAVGLLLLSFARPAHG